MNIIPAVDIVEGKCVRLVRGKKDRTEYGNPIDMAKKWEEEGAGRLHVVDIDGAMGKGSNRRIIKEITKAAGIPIQVGGGIRSMEDAAGLLSAGVNQVVISTLFMRNPPLAERMMEEYKDSVLVAIDMDGSDIVTNGWGRKAGINIADPIRRAERAGCSGLIVTDVRRDGTMSGIDAKVFSGVLSMTNLKVIAGGGVSSISDIRKLKEIGIEGVIIGKALYEGRISLGDALEVV